MDRDQLLNKLIKFNFNKGFLGGYFGTREASLFYENKEFMELLGENNPFFDISAGTGQFPFYLAQQGRQVFVNDICYYVGNILKCWSMPEYTGGDKEVKEWIREWIDKLDPKNIEPVEGYLTKLNIEKTFSKETSKYIDGILTKYPEIVVKYAVGNLLVTKFTFRARIFCDKTDTGRLNIEVTPEECYIKILKNLIKARRIREKLPSGLNNWANVGDSLEGLQLAPFNENTIVYMDTAWPYAERIRSLNPYRFFTETISSILEQREIKADKMWERTDSEQKIMNDVFSWIDLAFEKGAKYFICCTQSTNFPDPEKIVYPELNKKYSLVKLFKVLDYSNSLGNNYYNYWGFYKKK